MHEEEQDRGDGDVHGRPGERDRHLFRWTARNPIQTGKAADRKERDVLRDHPEAPAHERVAELVENDAGEGGEDESGAAQGLAEPASSGGALPRDPDEKQEEGRVNADGNPRNRRDLPGPTHRSLSG